MPKIVKPRKYKRAPDGKFAKKDSHLQKYSTRNWQCAEPLKKVLNTLNGEVHFKVSKEYMMHGCYIQICKDASIEDLTDTFIAKTKSNLALQPDLKTYNIRFWGDVVSYELKENPGVYHVTHGGFKLVSEVEYPQLVENIFGVEPQVNEAENNIGPDNWGVHNIGKRNFGYNNTGLENYGSFNKGVRLAGIFNTQPAGFFMFNRPVVTDTPWWKFCEKFPAFLEVNFKHSPGDTRWWEIYTIREQFEMAIKQDDWGEEHAKLLALPNFDYAIFEEITGISKQELDKSYDAWYKRTHRIKSSKRK